MAGSNPAYRISEVVMLFYVNKVDIPDLSDYTHTVVGLFTNNEWSGEGNFCGWYSSEYYHNTELLAYYVQEKSGGSPYNSRDCYTDYRVVFQKHNKIKIGSKFWEESFEAGSPEDAIEKFVDQVW